MRRSWPTSFPSFALRENFEKALRERFSKLPRISFDYAIMEKADRVLVVEASFDWDDIGSWRAVANYFEKDEQGNAANCAVTAVDSTNNVIFNDGWDHDRSAWSS